MFVAETAAEVRGEGEGKAGGGSTASRGHGGLRC